MRINYPPHRIYLKAVILASQHIFITDSVKFRQRYRFSTLYSNHLIAKQVVQLQCIFIYIINSGKSLRFPSEDIKEFGIIE